MVSNVKKGYLLEKKARDLLVSQGYIILFKSMRTRFGCQDFAGLFDIVAAKGKERVNISVKTYQSESRHKQHIEDLKKFMQESGLSNENCQLWFWRDNKWEGRII